MVALNTATAYRCHAEERSIRLRRDRSRMPRFFACGLRMTPSYVRALSGSVRWIDEGDHRITILVIDEPG